MSSQVPVLTTRGKASSCRAKPRLPGVDGLLLTVPYYNRPSQEGIYRHFAAIAAVVDLPCVLYNIPSRTGVNMQPETTLRLDHDVANIIGVKEASGNLEAMAPHCRRIRRQLSSVWSGDDSMTLPLLSVGGYGVICTCANIVGSPDARDHRLFCRRQGRRSRRRVTAACCR